MICPFMSNVDGINSSPDRLYPCIGSCELKVNGHCAITQIAIQLSNISKKLPNTNENSK